MKIKHSSKKASVASLKGVFAVVTLASIVIRAFQMLRLIDASTGFYSSESVVTTIFYLLVFLSCFVFCLVSYLSAESSTLNIVGLKDKGLSAVTSVFAVAMLFDWISSFLTSMSSYVYGSDVNAFQSAMSDGSLPSFFCGVFAFLSAVYFFFAASDISKGKKRAGSHKVLALSPIVWTAFRMISLFVSKISFIRVSDLLLELVMLSFMALFFLSIAQVESGVYSDGFAWRIPAFGLSSALIAGTISVPRLIFTFVDSSKYINQEHPFNICDLVYFIFVFVLLCTMIKNNTQNEITEDANAQNISE